ncbi:SH3 domain-containing protein [Planococcus halocryophilus]|uniref:SH3 domain-containing protein n=1 Tax=Planococcus halocryophilus TaxID=1215089 RepID=UPI001F0E6D55|nr:SH3 domain-containing protein [Planococcus halocryophilus]MCH4827419.1 SH3 domain-containing protein [Planococcus halocryophilus]
MKKVLSVIVLLFILVPLFSSITEATTVREVKKTQVSTQLRVSASPKASVISTLPKGSLVTQLNTVKGGWSYVQTSNKKGYVATSSLAVSSSKTKVVSPKSGLVIKETGSATSKTLSTLKQNVIVEDFGTVGGGWSLIKSGNVTGYANSKSITDTKPVKKYTNASVILRDVASTSGKKTGSLNKNIEVYVHSQVSTWSYVTSGSIKGYVPTSQLSAKKQETQSQKLNSFIDMRPSKIKWMKYYLDGNVLQGNVRNDVEGKVYSYTIPSVYTSFSAKSFQIGTPDSDFVWIDIPAPLTQNKAAALYDFDWNLYKDVQIGNAYLRSTKETVTTPAGTFKNVVHIETKLTNISFTIHYYFAPGYGLIKVKDSKNRLSYELRSYK